MALLTLADMRTEVYDITLDTDSANRSVDSTTLNRVLNRCYAHIRGFGDNRVYYVAAATSGASLAPQVGSLFKTLTETNYRRILEVYPAENNASTQPFGPALGRMEQWEIFAMQREDQTDRQIFASYYASWRQGSTTAANVGKFNLALWPISTVVYDYLLGVLKEVTALAGDTDKADCTEEEMHYVTDMASAICARWLGRPEEYIAQIIGRIPEELQTALGQLSKDVGLVKPRAGQEAA
jgi:hypothetical protein